MVNNDVDSTTLSLLQPLVKSKCGSENCLFISNALIGSLMANNFETYLFTKHGIRARAWKCSSCHILVSGHNKRFHIVHITYNPINSSDTTFLTTSNLTTL